MFIEDEHNTYAIMAARYVLVSHISIKLTYKEVSERVKFLKRRYNFFKRIVETPGVIWDREQRIVHATKEQWSILALSTTI
ncbi:hypothetical protein CASFOL_005027 [Castilleja foliolosa]|uniref:Myb/SANT-like domain-containing protein n=1 Tax=Castilleja foliolosa TaxID=1961234 RepID=A0ABD3E6B0_9LAMI